MKKIRISESLKTSFINFFSLGLLKATDAVVLLLLIPIIIQSVGIANYGIIAFVQVMFNYIRTISDYGFNITGVREVALTQSKGQAISQLFTNIFTTRILIASVCTLLLILSIQFIPEFNNKALVFYTGYLFVIGNLFFFDWLFIGLQQSQYLTIANLVAKIAFAVLVLAFVHVPADYIWILFYQGLASLITGLFLLFWMALKLNIKLLIPQPQAIVLYLKQDFKLLYTNFIIEFNNTYGILVLSFLTNDTLTGYFNVMYKLVQPIRFLLVIFSQTIFPVVCEKAKLGWEHLKDYLFRAMSLFVGLPILAVLVAFLFAPVLILYFAKSNDPYIINNFRVYLLLPLVILCNIPAYQILLAYERKSDYSKIYLISLFLKLGLDYFLTLNWGLSGLVGSTILVELFIVIGLYYMVFNHEVV